MSVTEINQAIRTIAADTAHSLAAIEADVYEAVNGGKIRCVAELIACARLTLACKAAWA
jgi:hypothetical protein